MAGNYPDVSSWRMAWDVDGTQLISLQDIGVLVEYGQTTKTTLNDESVTSTAGSMGLEYGWGSTEGQGGWVVLVFPELRDLDGFAWGALRTGTSLAYFVEVLVSSDTTNGADGTWTVLSAQGEANNVESREHLRTKISWTTALSVRGVRFRKSSGNNQRLNLHTIHLFGEPAPGENLQRLEIWHPTLDQRLSPADLDWGDVPRDSVEVRQFRVKNMHPTMTANNVRVAMSSLTDTTPSVVGQQSLSQDGVTWAAQQTINSLDPEEISNVLRIRRNTLPNASLGLWWYRVFADTEDWS